MRDIEVNIEQLVFGGKGLARLENGQVVFVIGDCLKGEKVKCEVIKKKKDFLEARIIERLSDSKKRIQPPCPYFGKCGGCNYQNTDYSNQLKIKENFLLETLKKISKLENLKINPIIPSENQWRYRHKLELTFFAENDGAVSLGFMYQGTWFKVIDIDDCLLFDENIKEVLKAVRSWYKKHDLTAFHNKAFKGLLRNFVIKKSEHKNEFMAGIVTTDEPINEEVLSDLVIELKGIINLQSFYHRIISPKRKKGETYTEKLVWGNEYITESLNGIDFQLRFADFFQNNVKQAEKMIDYVIENIEMYMQNMSSLRKQGFMDSRFRGNDIEKFEILDLYCGVGTFTLPIAKASNAKITGIEIVKSAIESAKKNAELNKLKNINFICKDVNNVVGEVLEDSNYDTIVVDPPRAGLGAKVVTGLLNSNAKQIIYVSCNPSTLARDLEGLALKYDILEIQPFDLFPQTYHVECIAVLVSGN